MNRDKEKATKQGKNVVDSFFPSMHKFSGCAGDGKLTVSARKPYRGKLSMKGMYMAILIRCSLDHKSIPQ